MRAFGHYPLHNMALSLGPEFIEQLSEIQETFQQLKKPCVEFTIRLKEEYIDMKETNNKEFPNQGIYVERDEIGTPQGNMNETEIQSGYVTIEDEEVLRQDDKMPRSIYRNTHEPTFDERVSSGQAFNITMGEAGKKK